MTENEILACLLDRVQANAQTFTGKNFLEKNSKTRCGKKPAR